MSHDKDVFGGEAIYISERFDEMVAEARIARARELGIDPDAIGSLRHAYGLDGVYRGDILESRERDAYHYGTPRHSGRYPWGSGENPYQRNATFLGKISELKKAKNPDGSRMFTDKQIAESMGMNTSEMRKRVSAATAENRAYLSAEAKRLKDKGMSTSAIARRMGKNESSVRLLLDEEVNERMSKNVKNATLLKERVNEHKYIDIGKGSEEFLGLSSTAMTNTIHLLEEEGYVVQKVDVPQLGTGKMTTTKVLCPPGTEWKDVHNNIDKIKPVTDLYSEDGGNTVRPVKDYVSVDPKRIQINYPSTGGDQKDGVIELRRGVDDISLGKNHYAQVRILVDGDHYMKGMAMYADDLPDGVDIRFNTSKPDGTPIFKRDGAKDSVLKKAKEEDRENPFGANIKDDEKLTRAQRHWVDENGVEHQSAINIVKEEGDVNDWSRKVSSQFLSKQSPALAKQQLKMAYDISKADMDEIASYTNPVVKASLLEDFAGRCETDSVHLKAAAFPRQANKFILPLTNIGDNEVYAPGYRDGEEVVLVRHPHGHISEIPRLVVNNNNALAKSTIGEAIDAVGISPKTAGKLSGADFDGDTVLVIPTSGLNIKTKGQLEELKGFNETFHETYKGYDGMKKMTPQQKGMEMGKVSNLITDMTIRGANEHEIAMALKHSMVVIDAEKHGLNYKQSEIDNHIDELKKKYQARDDDGYGGASTFISRAKSQERIPERKLKAPSKMTPEEHERYLNGEQIWVNTGKTRTFWDPIKSKLTKDEKDILKNGSKDEVRELRKELMADGRMEKRVETVTEKTTKAAVYDPYDLVSGGSREKTTSIERVYADYSTSMKDLARQARKIAREQDEWKADPAAKKLYSQEVQSLNEKLSVAKKNGVLERQAQRIANKKMDIILEANPELEHDKEHFKREKGRQLDAARKAVGAKKLQIGSKQNPLTDREWKAIESHAVSKSTLIDILKNADKGRVRELAMPKTKTGMPAAKVARAKAMLRSGYSRAEICDMLDVSEGKLINALEL